jgi:phage host-nuclease inhibitor protein Gam
MNVLDQQFNTLNDKLQLLLKQMGQLQRENSQLRTELRQARESEAAAQAQVDELKQQAAILKFAAFDMTEADKKEFERTISRYIRQLDKTIAYLSQ